MSVLAFTAKLLRGNRWFSVPAPVTRKALQTTSTGEIRPSRAFAEPGVRQPRPRPAMSLQALIFDFDGTLADTEETHRQAFNSTFLRLGLKWEWPKKLNRELLGDFGREGTNRPIHRIPSDFLGRKARLRQLVPAIHREKTRLYAELIADGRCALRPGIVRLLNEAQTAGVRLAIVSTTNADNVAILLTRHLGASALHMFSCIACGDHVAHKKPAPDVYHLALAMLGEQAHHCIAFEDSLNGLRAAKAAGIFTVMTPSEWDGRRGLR